MANRERLSIGTDTVPPLLFRDEYPQWKDRFLDFIDRQPLGELMLKSIEEGPAIFYTEEEETARGSPPIVQERRIKTLSKYTAAEKERAKADKSARSYLLLGISNEIYNSIDSNHTTQALWNEIKKQMMGTAVGERIKVTTIITQYEQFKAKRGERLVETYNRFCSLINDLRKNSLPRTNLELNVKPQQS